MIWTDLLLAILIMAGATLFALWWASSDNKKRLANIANRVKEGLSHGDLLGWRIVVLAFGSGGVWLWLKLTGSSMWLLVPAAALAWSWFGSVHILRLTSLSKVNWRFLTAGAFWDRMWLKPQIGYDPMDPPDDVLEEWSYGDEVHTVAHDVLCGLIHKRRYDKALKYPSFPYAANVHKAGSRAMVFRVAIAGMALITFTLHSFLA